MSVIWNHFHKIKHIGGVKSTDYVYFWQYPLFVFHDAATTFNSAINAVIYRIFCWLMDKFYFCDCSCTIKAKAEDSLWPKYL